MVSIKDISRELGIAVSTVSMALNDNPKISAKTRELVQEKAREMRYVKNGAAVDLQKKKTGLILFVIYDASRSFFSETIKRLQAATSELGYDFLISTTYGGHSDTAQRFIRERRSDAVIVYTKTIDDELLNENASADFPIFVLGHKAETENPYVRSFLYSSVTEPLDTCEYLIEKGHRRIGFVTGFAESYGTIRSMNGYRLSMKNHGLPIDESLIFDAKGSQAEDGYRVCQEDILKRLDDMDAVIFSNDDIAVGAMKCFNDHGISIPERIS
ncbi:MAG: LacI family DNA-binding transcriptional regulator, partial [Erysipelotrichaceae bacterium]|nr:LacI family DNA-binding transcriptional regulator [Erysipelotrichaceae bacterium]